MPFEITRPLDQQKTESMLSVNAMAGEKILAKYPQWKQANMQAKWSNLVFLDAQLGVGVLTNQNGVDGLAIQSVWSWIERVRNLSNVTNASILNANSYSDIVNLLLTYKSSLGDL